MANLCLCRGEPGPCLEGAYRAQASVVHSHSSIYHPGGFLWRSHRRFTGWLGSAGHYGGSVAGHHVRRCGSIGDRGRQFRRVVPRGRCSVQVRIYGPRALRTVSVSFLLIARRDCSCGCTANGFRFVSRLKKSKRPHVMRYSTHFYIALLYLNGKLTVSL